MTGRSNIHNQNRKEYTSRLLKARDEFLRVFYNDGGTPYPPTQSDLMAVLITQNMEILDLLRNGSQNLNSKTTSQNFPKNSQKDEGVK